MHASFVEADITPEPGLRLAGMPDAPRATGVHCPLHGRIALFDDGERRAAIVSADLLCLDSATVRELKPALGADDVLVSCTHTHRAPHTVPLLDVDPDTTYLELVHQRLAVSAREAAGALAPVGLRVGSARAPGWAFNRRAMYDGEVATAGPHWVEDFEGVEGPADDELQVVLAVADGRVLGGLVAFACHTTVVNEPVYSADFAGPLTAALSARHGGVFAFLQGASGDVFARDMSAPGRARGGVAYAGRMGRALADAADGAIREAALAGHATIDGARALRIRAVTETLAIPQRRPSFADVEQARRQLEQGAEPRLSARTFYADSLEIETWFARETIGMWEWQRRAGSASDTVEVQVLAIGDVAFVAYPGEMFAELGLRTKAGSTFAATIVCGLANGWHGYIPTRAAFDHGGYETRLAYSSRLEPEAGDRMTEAALRMLTTAVRVAP